MQILNLGKSVVSFTCISWDVFAHGGRGQKQLEKGIERASEGAREWVACTLITTTKKPSYDGKNGQSVRELLYSPHKKQIISIGTIDDVQEGIVYCSVLPDVSVPALFNVLYNRVEGFGTFFDFLKPFCRFLGVQYQKIGNFGGACTPRTHGIVCIFFITGTLKLTYF